MRTEDTGQVIDFYANFELVVGETTSEPGHRRKQPACFDIAHSQKSDRV